MTILALIVIIGYVNAKNINILNNGAEGNHFSEKTTRNTKSDMPMSKKTRKVIMKLYLLNKETDNDPLKIKLIESITKG